MPEKPKVEQRPKFKVGQVVMLTSIKKQQPFIIRDIEENDDGFFYAWNRKNYAAESMIRALTPEESGVASRAPTPALEPTADDLQRIRKILFAAMEMKESSLEQCDRSALELAMIASNAIFWRNKEIEKLRASAPAAAQGAPDGLRKAAKEVIEAFYEEYEHFESRPYNPTTRALEKLHEALSALPSSPVSRHSVSTPGGAEGSKE